MTAGAEPADDTGAVAVFATEEGFAARAAAHQRELHVHCYRMLGSFEEAEDLVQETLLRAWQHRQSVRDDHSARSWLYKVATNACLDHLKAKGRRVATLTSFRDIPWFEPYPDRLLDQPAPSAAEPATAVISRETIGLAFLAVLQLLPPRQRAAFILREVLEWPVPEIARLLEITVPATNSALQRARATLRDHPDPASTDESRITGLPPDEQAVLDRYVRAYEDGDIAETLDLLTDDIRVTMPPAPFLFEGIDAILGLARRARDTGAWRLLPTTANRQPAAACYLREAGGTTFNAFKLDVLRVRDGAIAEITTFGPRHFAAFGLPDVLRDGAGAVPGDVPGEAEWPELPADLPTKRPGDRP